MDLTNPKDRKKYSFFEKLMKEVSGDSDAPASQASLGELQAFNSQLDNKQNAQELSDLADEEVNSELTDDANELNSLSNMEMYNQSFEDSEEANMLNSLADEEASTDGGLIQPQGLADLRMFDESRRNDVGSIRKLLGLKDKMEEGEALPSQSDDRIKNLMEQYTKLSAKPTQEQPKPDRLSDLLKIYSDRMASASEADASSQFQNSLLRAAIQAGSAIAGSKADYSGVDRLPASKFEQGAKQSFNDAQKIMKVEEDDKFKSSLRDPNSALGKLYKKFDLDADTAFRAGITPAQLLSIKSKEDALKMKTAIDAAKTQQKELQKLDETAKKRTFDITKMLQKDYVQYQDAVKNANQVDDMLADLKAGKLHQGSVDVGLLYKFIKAYDPTSVVREGEIKLAQEAMSMFDNIRKSASNVITGAMLTPQFRESISKLAQGAKTLEAKRFGNLKKQYEPLANEYGIAADKYNKIVYPDIDLSKVKTRQEKVEQKSTDDKVEVTLPDGRKGRILRSKLEAFKSQYPDAEVKE